MRYATPTMPPSSLAELFSDVSNTHTKQNTPHFKQNKQLWFTGYQHIKGLTVLSFHM